VNFAYDPSGCTAVAALVTPEDQIIVANAGDSRAVISVKGSAKPLSYDHKPSNDTEMDRIVRAGGFVEFGRVNEKMGQTLSAPVTEKTTTHDANSKYFYGCSHMQGWRLTMEDAHTTLLSKDDSGEASFFGVYDGHGGSTIAQYTGQTLFKKVFESKFFEKKEYAKAMTDGFLTLDRELSE
ncbi:PP2C-domain-containing protein, partial [Backusella circina FSU 941]